MIEIIGENLKTFMDNMHINAILTYSGKIGYWDHFEVWEVNDDEFKRLCETTDEQFEQYAEDDAWWRQSDGSVMGSPCYDFVINGQPIVAWRDYRWEDRYMAYWETMSEEAKSKYKDAYDYCDMWMTTEYKDILEYFCDELGVSAERNVCALATDLAKYNNMTIAELFERYGG